MPSAKRSGRSTLALGSWAVVIVLATGCAGPSTQGLQVAAAPIVEHDRLQRLAVFEPRPEGRTERIDYVGVDRVLKRIVLLSGPSLRKRASRPAPSLGTRIVYGHVSPFRLEGNKIIFSKMTEGQREAIFSSAEDLITFGNQLLLTGLPRSAQLAYWLNLHNMLVISELLKRYPLRVPRRLEVGPEGTPFHDAPLATIHGVPLSLRDIRVGIVYRYWSDPRVMYGFFRGDLASPSIRKQAYEPATVWKALEDNAFEFVNALRGVHRRLHDPADRVSPIYQEAPAVFPDWPADLVDHLKEFAGPAVASVLTQILQQ